MDGIGAHVVTPDEKEEAQRNVGRVMGAGLPAHIQTAKYVIRSWKADRCKVTVLVICSVGMHDDPGSNIVS